MGIQEKIDRLVKENRIVLFMKGTPEFPQCGYSQQVAAILDHLGCDYVAVNVLLDDAVRQGVKEYADWPTIPQLYVDGNFIGGCDIVREMFDSGALQRLLAGRGSGDASE
ncbi:MAG: Grx4 family monothiol glutaredoxin [Zetaproteobacteria bacterium]|nr:MAG: Grx4 family monothiol glutaredoxin [Zetaproteobacteria bacterium]